MQVPSPVCMTCGKRISSMQFSFRRMRIGRLEREDALLLLMLNPSYDDIFGNTYDDRMKMHQKLLTFNDNDLIQFLKDNDLTDNYMELLNVPIDAFTAFNALGIERICCKRYLTDPPIWPVFSPEKPFRSIIRIDKGERKRLVVRNGDGYTISSLDGSSIPEEINVVDQETTRDIEELDV